MGSKKTTTQKSNSTNTVAPPSWTMPGIQNVADQVTSAAAALPNVPKYTGDFVAGMDPGQLGAATSQYGSAADLAKALGGFTTNTIASYNPNASYDLTGKFDAAMHPLQDALGQNLANLRTSAADSGAYSGSRANAVLPALVMNDYSRNAADTLANISYEDHNAQQNRNLQFDAQLPSLIASALQSSTGAGDLLSQIAAMNQTQAQAGINNNLAKQQYATTAPFQGLDIASQLLQQLSGNYGTQTSNGTSTTTEKTGGLGAVVQGIAGLGSLAASFAMPGAGAISPLASLFGKAAGAGTAAANAGALAASGYQG